MTLTIGNRRLILSVCAWFIKGGGMIRDRQAILERVRSYYAANDVVRLALVFGSVAKDTYGDKSDVDTWR